MRIRQPAWFNRFAAKLKRPPDRWSNGLAIFTAVLIGFSLLTPGGFQLIPLESGFKDLLAMPMHLLFYVGMGGLIGFSVLITAPIQIVQAWIAGEWVNSLLGYLLFPFILPPTFWLLLFCNWLSRALAQLWLNRRTAVEYPSPHQLLDPTLADAPLIGSHSLWIVVYTTAAQSQFCVAQGNAGAYCR